MNEYDSDKMADVLMSPKALVKTDRPEEADVILSEHLLDSREGAGKSFPTSAACARSRRKNPTCSSAAWPRRKRRHHQARAFVDMVSVGNPAPPAAWTSGATAGARRWTSASRDREVRPPAAGARGRATAYVSIMEGCSKYCSYCVVPYTAARVSRRFEDVLTEVADWPTRRQGDHAAGPERHRLSRRMEDGEIADFACFIEYMAESAGHRAHPLRDQPSQGFSALDRHLCQDAQALQSPHLPAQHGSDRTLAAMKRGYTAWNTSR
jgi:tRNA-2-methylthio-N6-dimethylallyladenosine synthase